MATRYYSNVAPPTSLTAGINAITTTITIDSAAGLPVFQPYTLAIDPDTPTMELVQVDAAAGTTLTVQRAIDGTSASNHSAGAVVKHVSSARDFAESRSHEEADSAVHGVVGDVVGTTDVQTLSSKTLTSPVINNGSINNADINTNVEADFVNINATDIDVVSSVTIGSGPEFDGNLDVFGAGLVANGLTVATTSAFLEPSLKISKNVGQTGSLTEWEFGGGVLASVNSFGEAAFAVQTSSGAGVFTAGAGWSVVSALLVRTARISTINVTVQRTGANIVAGAGGDIADSLLGTINANWRPHADLTASDFAVFVQNSIGSGGANMAVNTGNVTLRSWNSAATISTGNNINFTATYVS